MKGITLVRHLHRLGGLLEADGKDLIIDAPEDVLDSNLLAEIASQKTAILELLQEAMVVDSNTLIEREITWRVEAMRRQLGNHEGTFYPTFSAREDITPIMKVECFSCGIFLHPDEAYRCAWCKQAIVIVLEKSKDCFCSPQPQRNQSDEK